MRNLLLTFLILTCYALNSYAEEISPPDCVGSVCLYQSLDDIDNKVYAFGKEAFGPLAFLKDENRFVSTGARRMETMNWVRLASCGPQKVVSNIHRVIKDKSGNEFRALLKEYEMKYGAWNDPGYASPEHKMSQWQWDDGTALTLIWNRNLDIVSIDLQGRGAADNDILCVRRAKLNK